MKHSLDLVAVAALGLGLAGCDTGTGTTAMSSGSPAAEAACTARVNLNNGTAGGATVTSSDFSEAGTLVTLMDQNGTSWRCLASNDGTVEDLSVNT